MKVTFKRFGLPYNPQKDKKNKNKIIRHIVWFPTNVGGRSTDTDIHCKTSYK